MLARYRDALGLGDAVWLPVPMPLMAFGAWLAEALPQRVFCRDTLRLLARGSVPETNATAGLLGREPSTLAHGLAITAPEPMVDLRVTLSPVVAWTLRLSLAFLWLGTAFASVLLQRDSGAMALLVLVGLGSLNTVLGLLVLSRSSPSSGPPTARRPR